MLLASSANKPALELNVAHWPGFAHSNPFHDSPAWHRFPAMQALPFQYSFGWQAEAAPVQILPFHDSFAWHADAVLGGAGVVTQFPFFPADCPGGHSLHEPFGQILRRRSASPGFGSGSLQAPLVQIRRRKSGSGTLLPFSFSLISLVG